MLATASGGQTKGQNIAVTITSYKIVILRFILDTYNTTIPSTTTAGTIVLETATTPADEVNYSLSGGGGGFFSMGSGDGYIRVAKTLPTIPVGSKIIYMFTAQASRPNADFNSNIDITTAPAYIIVTN